MPPPPLPLSTTKTLRGNQSPRTKKSLKKIKETDLEKILENKKISKRSYKKKKKIKEQAPPYSHSLLMVTSTSTSSIYLWKAWQPCTRWGGGQCTAM